VRREELEWGKINHEFNERVFANPSILAMGAPLISACLRLGRLSSQEYGSSYGNPESVKPPAPLAGPRAMIGHMISSFRQTVRRAITRPKFGRKLASSATS
jgi:hypothetical protein